MKAVEKQRAKVSKIQIAEPHKQQVVSIERHHEDTQAQTLGGFETRYYKE
jgi:hypothetical protein